MQRPQFASHRHPADDPHPDPNAGFDAGGAVTSPTLTSLFLEAVDRFGDATALRAPNADLTWSRISYNEVFRTARAAASGLRALGVERGDAAAILSNNRPEWAIADYACLCAGVRDVPIYPSLTAPQIAYILRDSGARAVFAEDEEQLTKLMEIRDQCPELRHIIVFDPPGETPEGVLAWRDFVQLDPVGLSDEAFREEALAARPESVATILYTSGTTGNPKGVLLTHANVGSNVRVSRTLLDISDTDNTLSFLPLSHVFQRMVDYVFFNVGCTIAYARDMTTVAEDLKIVRPTVAVSVPRLYERVYNAVTGATGVKGLLVGWAASVGLAHADAVLAGRDPGWWTRARKSLADKLVFSKLRAAVGGRLRFFVSGGAPLSPGINKFFFAAGLQILEGYGLTETSPVTNVNTFENFRIGTVGKAVPGTEIRIASDGEICIRGPQVMKGYFNRPEDTAEAIDEEGWFKTGDIGELDEDGFLRITDRKKDIIVTAGGKNIAPQPIENDVKLDPYIEQAVMVGDRRPFPSLLVVPDFEQLNQWAAASEIDASDPGALLRDARCQEFLGGRVKESLAGLARFEMPKKTAFLASTFTIEDGTLTPTQKVRRRTVEERHGALIESLYDEANVDRDYFTD
ncbi:MAG: long-chain fatty acid--CoA ligase [Gammaproteobacteria bacterium]|nr:long-chain fatty acid--CoA ligase [Gammaproteobacteria bacterium]